MGAELWDRFGKKQILNIFYDEESKEYGSVFGDANSVILPFPGIEKQYILINANDFNYDPISGVTMAEDFSAVIFNEKNNGSLDIFETIPKIHKGKYCFDGVITACRHANGRDWWHGFVESLSRRMEAGPKLRDEVGRVDQETA